MAFTHYPPLHEVAGVDDPTARRRRARHDTYVESFDAVWSTATPARQEE
ncbi:hypothetical protein [Streptomyces lonarensis]|uniref:Uncharacterized protein n=1 Tax=Streptomyces lonarensis TaxID=700599 RepID=A0A7X6D3N8_9ACTN|nr:hypothetical protein [Streptomyces lonarensis]NJQ07595.1 hypothetical protein [Streptomyces lonarensis]